MGNQMEFERKKNLEFKIKGHTLYLKGSIDETTDYSNIMEAIESFTNFIASEIEELVIDLSRVSHINSWGLKHWIGFLARLPVIQLRFRHCPLYFISLYSVAPRVFGSRRNGGGIGRVESILLEYECNNCGDIHLLSVPMKAIGHDRKGLVMPEAWCQVCQVGSSAVVADSLIFLDQTLVA